MSTIAQKAELRLRNSAYRYLMSGGRLVLTKTATGDLWQVGGAVLKSAVAEKLILSLGLEPDSAGLFPGAPPQSWELPTNEPANG